MQLLPTKFKSVLNVAVELICRLLYLCWMSFSSLVFPFTAYWYSRHLPSSNKLKSRPSPNTDHKSHSNPGSCCSCFSWTDHCSCFIRMLYNSNFQVPVVWVSEYFSYYLSSGQYFACSSSLGTCNLHYFFNKSDTHSSTRGGPQRGHSHRPEKWWSSCRGRYGEWQSLLHFVIESFH